MKTRRLGFSELRLSVIGLGTWAIGGTGYACGLGAQDDRESVRTIHAALDQGVNWIDTAPMYGLGHAEAVIGRAIAGRRDRVQVATKCGILWDDQKAFHFSLKGESLRRELEGTLRRLGTDYVDLYQIHLANPDAEIEEGWGCIAELIREGKVRYAGVSNFTLAQIQRAQRIHPLASLQPAYSLFNREIEREVMAYCAHHGIGLISYSPLCSGLITEGISRERIAAFAADDFRPQLPDFQDPLLGVHLEAIERLQPLAARAGLTLPQLAIGWVLRREETTAAIVGARCVGHVDEIVQAASVALDRQTLREIETILADHEAHLQALLTPPLRRLFSWLLDAFREALFHGMSTPAARAQKPRPA